LKEGLRVTITLPELSDATAEPSAASLIVVSHPSAPRPVPAVLSAGAMIVGGVLSDTVIVCATLVRFPAASVAVNVRVMTKGLAGVPAPPLLVSRTDFVGTPQLSVAVTLFAFAAGTSPGN